ncbi:hypothetical protein SLE2022_345160 [Rubroshorea leprosula]
MDTQPEKVYVALGDDPDDGCKVLDWTLKKWNSRPISIVILYVPYNTSKDDLVRTPFGKVPASTVSEEKVEIIRKFEQGKIDRLLSTYIAFCCKVKVKTEILKYEEPIHKLLVDSISRFRITKLVLGISFMKCSSWKLKSAINGSFYVHQHKPEFCELFIICGGKQVYEEGCLEDDQGIPVTKLKDNLFLRSFSRMFSDNSRSKSGHRPSTSSVDSQNEWESYIQEIESYFQHLSSLNLDEEKLEERSEIVETSPIREDVSGNPALNMHNLAERQEYLRSRINEAEETIQMKKKEAKENADRRSKAEWAAFLCTNRAADLEARTKEEIGNQSEIQKSLDLEKEQLYELRKDVEESKSRLRSLTELESELSSKLQALALARAQGEARLEKAVRTRMETIGDIEELRRQRDVFQRRIEFCREKDAIETVSKMNKARCVYREYTAEDVRVATDDFSERQRLKCGGDWTSVYRGRINRSPVGVKMFGSVRGFSDEDFQALVRLLMEIRHPHVVPVMGSCAELKCIIFEYMQNRSLREILSTGRGNVRKINRGLRWHDRFRIAYEIGLGLSFVHSAQPTPIVHGNLTPASILLDRNLVAKITGFGLTENDDYKHDVRSDVGAFGVLLLQLLTGRNWPGLVEDAMTMDHAALVRVLDETAGKWPPDLAGELARIAIRCASVNREPNSELQIANVMGELDELRKKADNAMARDGDETGEDPGEAPNYFLCPIYKEVMKNPHIAADGFSYELEAIEEWFRTGRDTSPMTILRLRNKTLTPNHNLRFLIGEWQQKRSTSAEV